MRNIGDHSEDALTRVSHLFGAYLHNWVSNDDHFAWLVSQGTITYRKTSANQAHHNIMHCLLYKSNFNLDKIGIANQR